MKSACLIAYLYPIDFIAINFEGNNAGETPYHDYVLLFPRAVNSFSP